MPLVAPVMTMRLPFICRASTDPKLADRQEAQDGGRVENIRPCGGQPDGAPVLPHLPKSPVVEDPKKEPPFGDAERQKTGQVQNFTAQVDGPRASGPMPHDAAAAMRPK